MSNKAITVKDLTGAVCTNNIKRTPVGQEHLALRAGKYTLIVERRDWNLNTLNAAVKEVL